MRFTVTLNTMHIGNQFKMLLKLQSNRKVHEYGVRKQLEAGGTAVVDAVNFLDLTKHTGSPPVDFPFTGIPFQKIPDGEVDPAVFTNARKGLFKDTTHPDWHEQPARVFHNHTSIFFGLDECLNLVKTNLVGMCLPQRIECMKESQADEFHQKVQRAILNAHVLDSEQKKLPKNAVTYGEFGLKHRREYGLSKARRNEQLLTKLFHICDSSLAAEGVDVSQAHTTSQIGIQAPLTVDGDPLLFSLQVGRLGFNRKRLQPYADGATKAELLSRPLPSIYPLGRLLSIHQTNVYRMEHRFPLRHGASAPYGALTMAVINFNMPFVKQSASQQQARLLAHAFGVAAAYAQRLYGKDVVELPEPLTLNCLQSDSRNFIFGALQVHSLDLNGEEGLARNLLWLQEPAALFTKCEYVDGRPVLQGYDPAVAETLMSFYRSQLTCTV